MPAERHRTRVRHYPTGLNYVRSRIPADQAHRVSAEDRPRLSEMWSDGLNFASLVVLVVFLAAGLMLGVS